VAPFLEDGQIVVLNPGRTFGALEFAQALGKDCFAKIILAEAQSLIYACRADSNGNVKIIGIKNKVMLAAYPTKNTGEVVKLLNSIYPCFVAVENVLVTGLENIGSILHPTVILFNAATIERGTDFYFYNDMTPRVANVLEQVDNERISIGAALGLKLNSVSNWVSYAYEGITGDTLCEKMRNNPAYDQILAPRELRSRLLLEDIPTGILPMMELAKLLKVQTPLMNSIFNISQALLNERFEESGRTIQSLGFENKTIHGFISSL
jgi:opine dehydrogenase